MSKKTNYNKMTKTSETEVTPVVDTETALNSVEPVSTEVVEETKPANDIKPEITYGRVVGCTKLNVRKEPSAASDIVRTVSKDEKIVINMEKSKDDFYCVRLGAIKGYCMKKYIQIIK